MDRDEVGMVSKKRRIDEDITTLEGDGSSKVVETQPLAAKFVDNVVYKLYYKGLVSKEYVAMHGRKQKWVAGLGVAICDQKDELLFETKEPVSDVKRTDVKVVEIRALIRGLSESLNLGIKKLVIYCEDSKIYQHMTTGKCKTRQKKVVKELMEEVQSLREKFSSSEANLVAQNEIKFACKLAREAINSQTIDLYDNGYDYCFTDSGGDNGNSEDDNPWAYGCGCDHWCVRDPPSENQVDIDDYIEYYSL